MTQISLTQRGPDDGGNCEYGWSDRYLDTHVISDVGKKRQHNEDSSLLCAPEDESLTEKTGVLIAIADGPAIHGPGQINGNRREAGHQVVENLNEAVVVGPRFSAVKERIADGGAHFLELGYPCEALRALPSLQIVKRNSLDDR